MFKHILFVRSCVNDGGAKRVCCGACHYTYCWLCLRKWMSGGRDQCGNEFCDGYDPRLIHLKQAKMTDVNFMSLQIYDTRACPACGTIIEFEDGCKHFRCIHCATDFCFVCLSIYDKQTGVWPCGSYINKCDLAPVQTVIPKRCV